MPDYERVPYHPVLVGNSGGGLYIGDTDQCDEEIIATKAIRLHNCRHVARWYGRTGGITSLAQHGPCGPRVGESRVGAPCPSALITGVVNVFNLSPEAARNFAAIEAEVPSADD